MRRHALLLLLAGLALPAAAHAHGGAKFQKGFVSTVSAVLPNVLGLSANVTGGDARLRMSNYSGKTVVILGYQGEPYLRFDRTGIYANVHSPAVYLNRFRRSHGLVPGEADPEAPPTWRKVGEGASYEWFDHRIHWNKSVAPPGVRRHPERVQKIFDWSVPGTADGKPFAVTGLLGYTPPASEGGRSWPMWGAAGGGLCAVLVAGGILGVRARGRKPRAL